MKTTMNSPETLGNATSQVADTLFWSGWRRALSITLLLASLGLFTYVATLLMMSQTP